MCLKNHWKSASLGIRCENKVKRGSGNAQNASGLMPFYVEGGDFTPVRKALHDL